MHRLKSPLLALMALLMCAVPLAGRVTQDSPGDPYQISTPSSRVPDRADAPEARVGWTFDHEGITGEQARTPVYGVGFLLRSSQRLMLVDLDTLQPLWDQQFGATIDEVDIVDDFDSMQPRAIAVSSGYQIHLIDIASGDVMWAFDQPTGGMTLTSHGDTIIRRHYHQTSGSVFVLDYRTGDELWSATGTSQTSDYVAIGTDAIAVVEDSTLAMHDLVTGDVLWTISAPTISGMHFVEDSFVILDDAGVTALEARTGNSQWSTPLAGQKWLITDRYGYLVMTAPGETISIDSRTGSITWRVPVGEAIDTMEDLGSDNLGRVALADGTSAVYSGLTGELLFHLDDGYPGDEFGENHIAFEVRQTAYVTNVETATIVFELPFSPETGSVQAEFAGNWLVYVLDNEVHSVNLGTGENHLIKSSTEWLGWSVTTATSVVIVLTEAGAEVYSLASGQLITTAALSDFVRIFEQQGRVFLFDGDTVVGLDLETEEVMFQRDALGLHLGGMDDGTSFWAATNDDMNMTEMQAWDSDGNVRWSYIPANPLFMAGVFDNGDSQELWVADPTYIYVIDGETGVMRMKVPLVPNIEYTATVFRPHGVLMYDGFTTTMYTEP